MIILDEGNKVLMLIYSGYSARPVAKGTFPEAVNRFETKILRSWIKLKHGHKPKPPISDTNNQSIVLIVDELSVFTIGRIPSPV